jgi:hypothetical protein
MCDGDSGRMPTVDECDALERSLDHLSSVFIDKSKNEPAPPIANTTSVAS